MTQSRISLIGLLLVNFLVLGARFIISERSNQENEVQVD
jgi:hypothetical protein